MHLIFINIDMKKTVLYTIATKEKLSMNTNIVIGICIKYNCCRDLIDIQINSTVEYIIQHKPGLTYCL